MGCQHQDLGWKVGAPGAHLAHIVASGQEQAPCVSTGIMAGNRVGMAQMAVWGSSLCSATMQPIRSGWCKQVDERV